LRYCGACSSPSVSPEAPVAAAETPAAAAPAPAAISVPAESAPARRVLSTADLPPASLSIRFLPDSTERLATGSETALAALAAALKAFDEGTLVLIGHAAPVGRPEGELLVSEGRARFVSSFLEAAGLPSGLAIRVEARGAAEPATVPGGVEASRAASRRVEVKVE
ncbi:MAG TPA: OmpA family protein, partial [Spirochaetales bacterium]|nr:OmpA family protein [Spirochaetales bacterium]